MARAREGAAFGLRLGAWFAALAAVGAVLTAGGSLAALGVRLPVLLAVYLVVGPLVGAFVGLTLTVARTWWGAPLVGIVVAGPVALGLRIAVYGLSAWSPRDTFTVATFCLLLGGLGGVVVRAVLLAPLPDVVPNPGASDPRA